MTFPWQDKQWRQLLTQYQQGRLPHSLLLTGASGLGKLIFAQEFAHYLLCKQPSESMCGDCSECHLILAGNHPDLLKIFPEENTRHIKIEQIRQLILTLSQTAQRGGWRIAIIAPAQELNQAAANALLKIMEEPVGRILFLLVSDQWGALPATIRSRCQQIPFIGMKEANDWLISELRSLNIETDAQLLLKITEGAPLRALELAKNNYLVLRDQLLDSLMTSRIDFSKQDVRLWLDAFTSLVVDILRARLGVSAHLWVNQDKISSVQKMAQTHSREKLWAMLQKLNEARRLLSNSQIHLNEPLLAESLLIHWN